jgi:hypothetical protein
MHAMILSLLSSLLVLLCFRCDVNEYIYACLMILFDVAPCHGCMFLI